MNTTLNTEIKKYEPVLFVTRLLPRKAMKRLRFLFGLLFAFTLLITLLLQNNLLPSSIISTTHAIALCLIFGALWIEQICLYAYHNWHYFRGLDSTIGQKGKSVSSITYDVAEIFSIYKNDLTRSFLSSTLGQLCMERLEIPQGEVSNFLKNNRTLISASSIALTQNRNVTLPEIAGQLYQLDTEWQRTLNHNAVSEELFLETVSFVDENSIAQKRSERWWSRDSLSRTVGMGSELAYGNTPFIERFSQPILFDTIFSEYTGITAYTTHHANKILNVLAAHSASNVLILGAVGVGKMDIVYTATYLLTYGEGLHSLHGHHIVVVDTEHLLSATSKNNSLEEQVVHFFEEALAAGNITLVIPSLQTFISQGEERGLMIVDILDNYLAHPSLHIIAIDTPESIHSVLQKYKSLLRRFENLIIEPANLHDTTLLLKAATHTLEVRTGKIISYPAILQIAKSAERYLTDGVMPDRAISLLDRIFDTADESIITRATVNSYLTSITGIDVGPLAGNEREDLLNLETTLAAQVAGQTKAVAAVADTLRRVRIDTTRQDKPKGSFLFLGPTGVGKTELAKALALAYSKSEEAMLRFDMSEFSHADALGYLIGDHNGTGMLTDQLRDHPFSVILFDEFEKAHPMIHDLFLQILDEGYFTSTHSGKVNACNTIIIATSNAGSSLISQKTDSPVLMEEIIRHLIETKVFRPELLNRFDETIIFKPLSTEASKYIIQKNLTELVDRLRQDGYTLEIEEGVVDVLLKKGFSLEFGARPLKRAIQDLVESEVARQIILQDIKPGGTVEIKYSMVAEKLSK
ncbi:MAG: AAA family ATPase [Candidatus Paceibacteria bacterium]